MESNQRVCRDRLNGILGSLHALWGGKRRIVIGTYALYFVAYSCLVGTGVKTAIDITPHVHYSKLAKMCSSDDRPALMSALWAFALFSELIVFAMTLMKALQHRRSHDVQTPLLKSLYRDQFFYYTVPATPITFDYPKQIIIFVRTFNLCIWNVLPPSLLYLGVSFIWALVTALVSRIMLKLRGVACSNMQTDQTFFAETAYSTRIVWARRYDTFDTSLRTITPEDERAAGPPVDAGAITSQSNEERGGEGIELQDFRSRTHKVV